MKRSDTIVQAVRGIIIHDGKILLVENNSSFAWTLPWGKVDAGETLMEALERELYEELHVRAKVGKITHVHDRLRPGKARVEHFFLIENPEDFVDVDFSQASHDFELLGWNRCPIDSIDVDVRPWFLVDDLLIIDSFSGVYRVSDER